MKRLSIKYLSIFLIIGCYNNPTPPSEIIGSQISGFQYGLLDCQKINDEIMFLEEREKTLVIAQEKRVRAVKYSSGGQKVMEKAMGLKQ